MRYHVAHIQTHFQEEWQADVFVQALFDLGFDSMEGDCYYIPSQLLTTHRAQIEQLCDSTDGVTLVSIEACPDENWNATWEAEHPIQQLPLGIRIVPHCAFGAGHHETTSMMIEALMTADLKDLNVLDHGTGTGVLAIFAKRLGAKHVLAVDIDEHSVANAQENAALNNEFIDVQIGDCVPAGHYHLILANIHRNVLLSCMDQYAACLEPKGQLWLSGFYESDCPALIAAAQSHGLHLLSTHANGEWRMLQFIR